MPNPPSFGIIAHYKDCTEMSSRSACSESCRLVRGSRLHGEIPIAFVALRPGVQTNSARLRDWCKEHLGRHQIPRRFEPRESLPRNAAGKILKRELRRHGELERGVDNPP